MKLGQPVETKNDARSVLVLLCRGAWVLFGFWGFQFDWLQRLNAWWMGLDPIAWRGLN